MLLLLCGRRESERHRLEMTKAKENKENKSKCTSIAEKSLTIKTAPKQRYRAKMSLESGSSNEDLRALLLSIKESQCTKDDMKLLTKSVNKKLNEMDVKLTAHDTKIETMNKRLDTFESEAASARYQSECDKQRTLKNNISIFGIERKEKEDLLQIVLNICEKIGCKIEKSQVVNHYRINNTNIIIVQLCDFELKQQILGAKAKEAMRASDISGGASGASNAESPAVYINNHVTPFFGKLLREGRQAVKKGDIHSCFVNSHGCQLKFEENGKPHNYKSVDELNKLIEAKAKINPLKRSLDDRSPSAHRSKK